MRQRPLDYGCSIARANLPVKGKISGAKIKIPVPNGTGIAFAPRLDSAGNFTGTQTPGTNVHMAGRTVDDRLNALHIGLPHTIGASVGVGHSDTESHALVAELTLSHPLHLLAVLE